MLSLFYVQLANADTIEDIAKKAHLASINTLLIFTSQDSLNSGLYHFTKVGVDMHVYHLPFSYTLKQTDKGIEYFIVGNLGYSTVNISKDVIIPPNSRLNYENHISTYTAGIGGGIRYKFTKEFSASGGIELIYSRSGAKLTQPDDAIGDAIEGFFNKNFNDNISYKFFTDVEYKTKFKELNPYVIFSYKTYQTKSSFSFDELISYNTDSSVATFTIGAQSNELISFDKNYITLESYFNANYLNGDIANTVKFNNYASLGAISYLYSNVPSWIKRYFLEVNLIKADGLDGYNIGVGFTINY
ncbi:hypothetical protein SMGD1_2558 [Sulfurimonas gotlandica GD1]|uniref:Uncharacterized protein n=1 Tax=Sulfurimonas gotlandica (strain DSM 19862 / JCM 16533 / GD1) TaxID=929558 RepID=B6BNK7_SULGG|nr:hypothetical protein [Sulfurimonas gotlandica]EDZ61370.1 hypothetical protein CBGD1_2436 [Sulfurimonas gotlandica GD1]EHP31080.1 hypothetical protein SMGD1_2558 [Sulfurimonas gotlandica GD1]